MSTRSRIGIEDDDGTILSVYCHSDGDPDYTGRTLVEHYQDKAKVESLLELGNISSLGEGIGPCPCDGGFWPGPDTPCTHHFQLHTRAYARDRGDDDTEEIVSASRAAYLEDSRDSSAVFVYLLTVDGWTVARVEPWGGVAVAFAKLDQVVAA